MLQNCDLLLCKHFWNQLLTSLLRSRSSCLPHSATRLCVHLSQLQGPTHDYNLGQMTRTLTGLYGIIWLCSALRWRSRCLTAPSDPFDVKAFLECMGFQPQYLIDLHDLYILFGYPPFYFSNIHSDAVTSLTLLPVPINTSDMPCQQFKRGTPTVSAVVAAAAGAARCSFAAAHRCLRLLRQRVSSSSASKHQFLS